MTGFKKFCLKLIKTPRLLGTSSRRPPTGASPLNPYREFRLEDLLTWYDNDNAFISDSWPIRPNRQLGLYADIYERKIQGYAIRRWANILK